MSTRPVSRPALENVRVLDNTRVASGVGLISLHAPGTASTVQPGQFVHLRIAQGTDFLLRRPFSVHRAVGERIEILYQTLGRGTLELAQASPGATMDLVGPLGTGWTILPEAEHALLVGGGLGAAPLGMLAEELGAKGVAVTVALGAPTRERLLALELFDRTARRVELATDDGSAGAPGFVTLLTEQLLASETFDSVYVCGPEIMERVVVAQAAAHGVRCQVSLERLMACGVGACLSCVCSTAHGRMRTCVDGPVFDGEEVLWDESETPPRH